MSETMDNNIEYKLPEHNQDANIIGYIETDIDFRVEDDPIFYIYGVALGWRVINGLGLGMTEYVVWTCGCYVQDGNQSEWHFYNGHYFKDVHQARDNFAYRANLKPETYTAKLGVKS